MTTANTHYNPFFRATRLALAELTTPEAQRWYWQQIRNSAVLAQRITLQGVTVARRWFSAIHGQAAVVEPEQDYALTQSAAPEQTNAVVEPVQDDDPATELTEAHASPVDEQQQEHEAVDVVAVATDLEPKPASTAGTATDEVGGAADDYELLKDCDDIPTAEDEPLTEVEASEEDTSFYEPEDEDATDDLTHEPEDTAEHQQPCFDSAQQPCFDSAQQPCFDPAQQPSRLSLLIQEFKRQKAESSAEAVSEDGSVHVAHESNASARAAAFAWEDTPAEGDSEAELGHGEDSLALIEVDQGIDLFPTPTTRTTVSTIQVEKSFSVAPENFDSDADAKTGGSDDRKY